LNPEIDIGVDADTNYSDNAKVLKWNAFFLLSEKEINLSDNLHLYYCAYKYKNINNFAIDNKDFFR